MALSGTTLEVEVCFDVMWFSQPFIVCMCVLVLLFAMHVRLLTPPPMCLGVFVYVGMALAACRPRGLAPAFPFVPISGM